METGTKVAIGVGAAAVVGFGIYWFFIREGEEVAETIGGKPLNEMSPDEIKAAGASKVKLTQQVYDMLTPAQKDAFKKAGTVISIIKGETTKADDPATPATMSSGEGTDIYYIAPENAGLGDKANFSKIDLRVKQGVFNVGDEVKVDHPNYKGTYMVEIFHDGQDGGGSVVLDTPYIDKGGRNPDPGMGHARMDLTKGGKISVVAEATEELEAAGGKRRVRFLGKLEAKERKKKQLIGRAAGKKGRELRKFIRTGNEKFKPKNPKTFVKSPRKHPLPNQRRGADGSWSSATGYMC